MNLSKTFDTLNRKVLLAKLNAYVFSENNIVYIKNYLLVRSDRTLRSHLVRAKVYPVGQRLVGLRKFNKSCGKICKNVIKTDTFLYFVNKKDCKINHRFTLSDKCLVYLLSCTVCCKHVMVKPVTNSHAGGIIIKIIIRKV